LGLPSSRLRAVSGAHEGQDGEWLQNRAQY